MNYKKTLKKVGRKIYKATGYTNPIKKGKVSSSRIMQNIAKLSRDVAILKPMINAEKEIYTALTLTAQNVDVTTPYFQPITNVAEGTGHGQRDGESIKLHGFRWNTRFGQQNSVTNPLYAKMFLVKYIGPRGSTPAISTFLKPDFDGNYTCYSERNEDHYSSYIVISTTGLVKIPVDSVSGQTQYVMNKRYGLFKKDAHQRYSGSLATTLLTNQMYIIIVTSAGDTATSTGLKVDSQLLISFYDN